MKPRPLFFDQAGRLRTGWRVVVFTLVFIFLLSVLTTAGRIVYAIATQLVPSATAGTFLENILFRSMLLAAALGAGLICNRSLEELPWRALGVAFHQHWLRDLILGSLIGVVTLSLATAIATAAGGLTFTVSGRDILFQVVQTLVFSAGVFIVAALAEELLFRGYPLQTLTRAGLFVLGAIVTSLAFTAVHMENPNFKQGLPFVNLFLAGLWFAIAFWRTRSLWFPLGLHWAWNWALGSLFGLPVSGIIEIAPHPLLRGTDLGPTWLTGGSYGIEGGLAGTIALVLSTVFVWRMRWVSASEEMARFSAGPSASTEGSARQHTLHADE